MKDEIKKRVLDFFYNPSNREHILFDNYLSRKISPYSNYTDSSSYYWNRNQEHRENFEKKLYSNDLGLEYIMPNIVNFLYEKDRKVLAPDGYSKEFLRLIRGSNKYDFDIIFKLNDKKYIKLPNHPKFDRLGTYFFIANNNNYIIKQNDTSKIIELYNNIDIYLLKSLFINERINIYNSINEQKRVFYEEFNKIFEKNLILRYRFQLLAPKKTQVSLEKNMFGLPSNWIDIVEIPEYSDSEFLQSFQKCKVNKSIVRDLNLFCREEIKRIKVFESHKEIREQKEMEEKFSEDSFS